MLHLALASLLCFCSAFAKPSKFVGGAFYWNGILGNTCAVASYSPLDSHYDCESYPGESGYGGDLQVGVGESWWKTHIGFAYSNSRDAEKYGFDANGYSMRATTINGTRDYRLVIGGRVHAPGTVKYPLMPALGAGVTISIAEHYYRYERIENGETVTDEKQDASSKPALGWYLEPGFFVRVAQNEFVSFFLRLHYVDVHMVGDWAVDHDHELSGLIMLGYLHSFK